MPKSIKAPPSQIDMLIEGAKFKPAGSPGSVPGGVGDGTLSPTKVPASTFIPTDDGVGSEAFGSSGQPYTTSVLTDYKKGWTAPAGKLFFKIGSGTYVCSASLVKPGVVVTAAHCVSQFGASTFYTGHQFIPAYKNGDAPYGVWTASTLVVLTSYYNGTDSCSTAGVVCANDIAVIALAPQKNKYAGNKTGWYGYGWNGYGFNTSNQGLMTQLGYPVALNGGLYMERTDSQGATVPSMTNNTVIGSLQTGGSSGGPWIANFGETPTLSGGVGFGSEELHNVVVGVTSWGYTNTSATGPKQQGASPFTSSNITTLVDYLCNGAYASRC